MSTNARWRSPKSRSARSRRCASRRRRAITRSGTPTPPAITPRSIRRSTRRSRANGVLAEDNLENIYATYMSPTRLTRADRQGRQPGQGRDRAGHVDDRHRRRLRQQLHREPGRHVAKSSASRRTAKACARSSKAWCRPPRRWKSPTSKLEERLNASQAGNHRPACQPRSGAQRKPDRSADLALQPQILRHHAGKGDRRGARQERAAVADADRHRPFQELQRQLRPSDRRPGAAAGGDVAEAERQGPGHRRPLRRRRIRRHSAEHGAALGASRWPITSAAR